MKTTILIPKICKVGFNERTDTFTGMLGYIIYFDGKKWRKETSWESWREKYIDPTDFEIERSAEYEERIQNYMKGYWDSNAGAYVPISKEEALERLGPYEKFGQHLRRKRSTNPSINPVEFDNVPTGGFVLNKKVGGTSWSSYNPRQTYCRIYDPRGFEFEISIPNLLYILENTNSIKGKGLEGEFVYGWQGKDLILIPVNAPEYKEMLTFTENSTKTIKKADLIPGFQYLDSSNRTLTYMGYYYLGRTNNNLPVKNHIFFNGNGLEGYASYSSLRVKLDFDDTYPDRIKEAFEKDQIFEGFEYVSFDLAQAVLDSTSTYYSTWFITKQDNKYIRAYIQPTQRGYRYNSTSTTEWQVNYNGEKEIYLSINGVLKKHDSLWQIQMIKKSLN